MCNFLSFLLASPSDYEEFFAPLTRAIIDDNVVNWTLSLIDDEIALEINETLEVVFEPRSSLGTTIIGQLESAENPTFIRSTATITIIDSHSKNVYVNLLHIACLAGKCILLGYF